MIYYASRTGTRKTLAVLKTHNIRLLISAKGVLRTEGFRYALDNGAWNAFQQNEPFDAAAFIRAVSQFGHGADWLVTPDIVTGGQVSLAFSQMWRRRLGKNRCLLAVQDGCEVAHVLPLIHSFDGLFVGGSTEWKLATAHQWVALATKHSKICHIGRVNSGFRLRAMKKLGATSCDGSGASRWTIHAERMGQALRELHE